MAAFKLADAPAFAILARMHAQPFIWETHGIHVGTGADHVKHGIDDLDAVVERAIQLGFPSLTLIIHSPRLTRFRYATERDNAVKFIRGDASYFDFAARMRAFGKSSPDASRCAAGWSSSGWGPAWACSGTGQSSSRPMAWILWSASVHFAPNGIPYDGSAEDTQRLIQERGGVEPFWAAYFDELSRWWTRAGR